MLPTIGLGTWIDPESKVPPSTLFDVTVTAIKVGYRTFDCADNYGTEPYVVSAILQAGLPREDFYIISKSHRPSSPEDLQELLQGEGLESYDLFLLHSPPLVRPSQFRSVLLRYWTLLNAYVKRGLVAHIGVSNFYIHQMNMLLELCSQNDLLFPSVNQIELHPLMQNKGLIPWCQQNGISVMAHTPLGGLASPIILSNPVIIEIADELGFTPAQIVLGWELKLGASVLPRSFTEDRMKSNLDSYEVVPYLTPTHMDMIASLDVGYPLISLSQDAFTHDLSLATPY